jgi:hypothetical protein
MRARECAPAAPTGATNAPHGRQGGAEAEEKWKDRRLTAAASYAVVGGGPRGRALASTVSAGNRHAVKVHGTIAIMIMWNAGLGSAAWSA